MDIKEYEGYIQEKLDKVCSLYRSSKRQNEALEKSDTEKFLNLINRRDEFINGIIEIDEKTKGFSKYNEEKEIKKLLDKIADTYKKFKQLDEENMNKAMELKNDLANKVRTIKQGIKAIDEGYYAQNQYTKGMFFDQKIGKKK